VEVFEEYRDPTTVARNQQATARFIEASSLVGAGHAYLGVSAISNPRSLQWISALNPFKSSNGAGGALQLSLSTNTIWRDSMRPTQAALMLSQSVWLKREPQRKELLELRKNSDQDRGSHQRKETVGGRKEIGLAVGKILAATRWVSISVVHRGRRIPLRGSRQHRTRSRIGWHLRHPHQRFSRPHSEQVVGHYKRLSDVERAFRV